MEIKLIKELILKQYHFNLKFAEQLVNDIPPDLMSKHAGNGLENHPSFTLGHLATASAMTAEDLGSSYEVPHGWKKLFQREGPGDPRLPDPDSAVYPSKKMLLDELKKQHEKVIDALNHADDEFLLNSCKWRFDTFFPTILDLATFMCISHESMHLSQLSAWRRAMGFPSALATL